MRLNKLICAMLLLVFLLVACGGEFIIVTPTQETATWTPELTPEITVEVTPEVTATWVFRLSPP